MILRPHEARRRLARLRATDPLVVVAVLAVIAVIRAVARTVADAPLATMGVLL